MRRLAIITVLMCFGARICLAEQAADPLETRDQDQRTLVGIQTLIQRAAPQDWSVEIREGALKLHSPRVTAGSDNGVLLVWFTATRIDTQGFEVAAEYLGQTPLGHAYLSRSAATRADWPGCRDVIRDAVLGSTQRAEKQLDLKTRGRRPHMDEHLSEADRIALRRKLRLAGNDRDAAVALVGQWILTLPRGFQYDVELKQEEDGCLQLESTLPIVFRGLYTFAGKRLRVIDATDVEADDFVWEMVDGDRLRLLPGQHRESTHYAGTTLERLPETVADHVVQADPERVMTGTLTGRFEYDGRMIPAPVPLEIPGLRRTLTGEESPNSEFETYGKLGLTDESLIVGPHRGIKNVYIWIRDPKVPVPAVPAASERKPITITFQGGRLQPHAVAFWTAQHTLKLTNEDRYPINLRWDPFKSSPFNFLVPVGGSVTPKVEPDATYPSFLKSDILHWISPGVLLACHHPYFAVSDEEGRFTMQNLPVGEWEFAVWHERAGWVKTDVWKHGRFKQTINATQIDLGTIRVPPTLFQRRDPVPAPTEIQTSPNSDPKPKTSQSEKPSWRTLGAARKEANCRDEVKEFTGIWHLRLPAGFEYELTLCETTEGLMEFQCAKTITLLGKFAMNRDRELLLVESKDDGIDDFIWKLDSHGQFVLISESHRVGATYRGAVLRRTSASVK